MGICGTDRDIVDGFYGEAPEGSEYLVLGHESLCRVEALGQGVRGFSKGDLVVPTVRRNCPENCANCRAGRSDMCLTGDYKEHGIKGLHGFARELATSDSRFVVKLPPSLSEVGVLLEPMTVAEKGIAETYRLQKAREDWKPKKALMLGAGPVGLLGVALLRLMGLEVDAVATRSQESLKARLVEETGANYINAKERPLAELKGGYDVVFEATGSTGVALEAPRLTAVNGIVSYLGLYRRGESTYDAGGAFTNLVLGNRVLFGSVNANKSYFLTGVRDLSRVRRRWGGLLERLITRRARPEEALDEVYAPQGEEGIKTVIEFGR